MASTCWVMSVALKHAEAGSGHDCRTLLDRFGVTAGSARQNPIQRWCNLDDSRNANFEPSTLPPGAQSQGRRESQVSRVRINLSETTIGRLGNVVRMLGETADENSNGVQRPTDGNPDQCGGSDINMTPRSHNDENIHVNHLATGMDGCECRSIGEMDINQGRGHENAHHSGAMGTYLNGSTGSEDVPETTSPGHNDRSGPDGIAPDDDISMDGAHTGYHGTRATNAHRTERQETPTCTGVAPTGPDTVGSTNIHEEEEVTNENGAFDAHRQTPPKHQNTDTEQGIGDSVDLANSDNQDKHRSTPVAQHEVHHMQEQGRVPGGSEGPEGVPAEDRANDANESQANTPDQETPFQVIERMMDNASAYGPISRPRGSRRSISPTITFQAPGDGEDTAPSMQRRAPGEEDPNGVNEEMPGSAAASTERIDDEGRKMDSTAGDDSTYTYERTNDVSDQRRDAETTTTGVVSGSGGNHQESEGGGTTAARREDTRSGARTITYIRTT